jgi:hypothetical protein
MEGEYARTCVNLKLVSSVEAREKLHFSCEGHFVVTAPGWFQSIKRAWNGDSRMITFREISRTINTAIINYVQYEEVRHDLTSCITGLRNLKKTYAADKHAQATLEQIIATVECAVGSVAEPLPVVNFPVVGVHGSLNRDTPIPRAAGYKPTSHIAARATKTNSVDICIPPTARASPQTVCGSSVPLVSTEECPFSPRQDAPISDELYSDDIMDRYGDDITDRAPVDYTNM